jgi:CRISPR/Cas system CMR subunit Cmr4 (Cas7 group RAMP superfamily)
MSQRLAGKGGEVVDLSIQRNSYGFSTIYSSILKGLLKVIFTVKMENSLLEYCLDQMKAASFSLMHH